MIRTIRALRRLIVALASLGVAAYGAAALVTVADVIGRRFGLPIDGVVDLVQLFVMGGAWLVMPFAFMTGAHVGVDFLVDRVPRAAAVLLRALAISVAVVLLGLMFWYGYQTMGMRMMFGDRSQQLGIPIVWYWAPLVLGLAVSILGAALSFVAVLRPHTAR
ncbi:TRAP transporter small permease [Roseitranquillus sediminis]|uniref:TRAP transporter small permease n=1 Tax=Roseitranquillus sediminis TaxID=2809051 RepID=UPI001D0CBF3F|nr:TRAP transporter small permease subunit [Roseitranquillus sediminis]MBM9595405.1 TRAP transporter small permease [Roseitranquillus sediminis]